MLISGLGLPVLTIPPEKLSTPAPTPSSTAFLPVGPTPSPIHSPTPTLLPTQTATPGLTSTWHGVDLANPQSSIHLVISPSSADVNGGRPI